MIKIKLKDLKVGDMFVHAFGDTYFNQCCELYMVIDELKLRSDSFGFETILVYDIGYGVSDDYSFEGAILYKVN